MQNGIQKIDPQYNSYSFVSAYLSERSLLNSFIEVNLILNLFIINENYELDVIECSAFCENTGKWL
jgi:hypothetical protein